jgi:hypothetical protein
MPEGAHEVEGVDVVAHLLASIPEHDIRRISGRAFHQIGEKTMQLRSRMAGTRETTAAEASRLHAEIAPIFLDQDVGGDFGGTKQTVHRLVDAHGLINAVAAIRMIVR